MDNCIFCKIIAGDIPSNKVYEDEDMLAFRDINPQAKVHVLVVPKSHFATLAEMNEAQAGLVKKCLQKVKESSPNSCCRAFIKTAASWVEISSAQ